VAQERLQIRLDAIDNTKRAFTGLKGSLSSVKESLFSLRSALVGLGAGLAVRSIVNVGKQVENLNLRFKFLFRSATEGQKAFDGLVNFASKVPFTLEQIQAGAGNLAVVTKNAEELKNVLEITGNVASVTGLDFQQTAEQIQRAFSGGIASADVFRERGVSALLGFKAGATVTAEETKKRFQEVFGKGGTFGNATSEFANTLEGTLSMLQDKLFKFQKAIADGFFEQLKIEFGNLNKYLDDSDEAINNFGNQLGENTATAIRKFSEAVKSLDDDLSNLDGILGAILLVVGKFTTKLVGAILVLNDYNQRAEKLVKTTEKFALEQAKAITAGKPLYDEAPITNYTNELDRLVKGTKEYEEALYKLVQAEAEKKLALERSNYLIKEEKEAMDALRESLKFVNIETQEYFKSFSGSLMSTLLSSIHEMENRFKNIRVILAQTVADGIAPLSRGLAEAIVLGKDLGNAFKQFVLNAIINAVAGLIQYYLTKLLIFVLEKLFPSLIQDQISLEDKKLNVLKKQTKELQKQAGLRILLAFLGMAEGGRVSGNRAEGGRVQGYRANGGQTSGTNAYIVGERGRELFIPSTDGQIVSNENLKTMGGANITFNINATDVKGVKELLIDNRATITNIINSALNQKGKPALV
jgi:hypothetical protein